MKNADKIRTMTDDELKRFIWWWQVNALTKFLTGEAMKLRDAAQIYEWLQAETFKCEMTRTPGDEEDDT